MPITTVNISRDLKEYIDEVTKQGKNRTRRSLVLEALEKYRTFTMHEWQGPLYYIRGYRYGWLSRYTLQEILRTLSKEQAYEVGKRCGRTFRDCCLADLNFDTTQRDGRKKALEILMEYGWGKFELDEHRVVVRQPFLTKEVLRGHLEVVLGTSLSTVETDEDVAIFEF